MVRLQLLVSVIVLVAVCNIQVRAYRRAFAYPWIKALDEFRRNAACDIDLGLVMDNTKGNFSLIKKFTEHLVGKFQISDDGTRVGAITFGHGAHILLLFSDLKGKENNFQNVKKQINRWREGSPVYGNKTSISEALRVAKDFLYRTSSGMRSGQVEQVLVLFTNGNQVRGQVASTLTRIQELQNKGIKIIIVGIQKPDPIELMKIAGGVENVHWLNSQDRITSIATKIFQSVCSKA